MSRRRPLRYLTERYSTTGDERIFSSPPWSRIPKRHKVAGLTLLSLGTKELSALRLIGSLALYCLLFYLTYVLAQSILSIIVPDLAPRRGVRVILAGGSVALATGPDFGQFMLPPALFLLTIVGTCIVLDLYLARTEPAGWRYSDEYRARLYSKFYGKPVDEVRANHRRWEKVLDRADSLWLEKTSNYTGRAATVLPIYFPFIILGVFLPVFDYFYPVPELVLLIGALFGPVIARRSGAFRKGHDVLESLDSEGHFTDALSTRGTFHIKGLYSIMFIGFNLVLPAIMFLIFLGVATVGARMIFEFASGQPLVLVFLAGATIVAVAATPLIFGLYGLWFWRTELRRLPAYLKHWGAERTESSSAATDETVKTSHTRPPYGMLPPTVLLLTLPVAVSIPIIENSPGQARGLAILYLGVWASAMIFILWSIRRWKSTGAQSAKAESRVLVSNCAIQFLGVTLFVGILVELTATNPGWHRVGVFVVLPLLSIVLFYAEDARQWLLNKRGFTKLQISGITTMVATALYMLTFFYNLGLEAHVVLLTFLSVLIVSTTMIYVGQRLKEKYAPKKPPGGDIDGSKPVSTEQIEEPTELDDQ